MALAVIGSGFGRTGTMSLRVALEHLDFGPCHHMVDVFQVPNQFQHWQAAFAGDQVDWEVVFAGYRAQVDWPGAHFWRDLVDAFPQAKVIHSVRPVDSWWHSYSTTIGKALSTWGEAPAKARSDLSAQIIRKELGGSLDDRDRAIAAFHRRTEDVVKAVPAERLLVFDVAEGWEPLCRLLDVPIPQIPFPRLHTAAEFWDQLDSRRNAGAKLD